MAYFETHFFSDVLGLSVTASVLLPQKTARQIGMEGATAEAKVGTRYPVLYLLHGLSDDHTIWMRRTSIERYAAAKNLAVVMPAGARSFYQDMASGPRYWQFVSEELPALMQSFFPISAAREQNFAAGLSMGGYGALRLGLGRPRQFAAAASLSGALDVTRICREAGKQGSRLSRAELEGIFGRELKAQGTDADLWALAQKLATGDVSKPKLFLACGTEDGLLGENRAFRQHLESIHYEHTYSESPGDHEWGYWDAQIQRVLDWLPLPKAPAA
jgi:S-formylglutathione hydrolase FrmB